MGLELNAPEQTKQKNRLLFQPFADRVVQHFGVGRTVTVKLVTLYVNSLTLARSFRQVAIEARAQSVNPTIVFLRAFPEHFKLFKTDNSKRSAFSLTILAPVAPAPRAAPAAPAPRVVPPPAVPAVPAAPAAPAAAAAPPSRRP